MLLIDFLKGKSAQQANEFAKNCGLTRVYLSQLAHGHKQAGDKAIKSIRKHSAGKVKVKDLRPDYYGLDAHTPESIKKHIQAHTP